MSRPQWRPSVQNDDDSRLFIVSMAAAQSALGCSIVGIIGREADGELFITPAPGIGAGLFRTLADADWAEMTRIAEEHCT